MITGLILMVLLVSSITVSYAFADWREVLKKEEEAKAIKYQKMVLHFDYEKIQNKDKGFKSPVTSDVKKKHIHNDPPVVFKVIKNLNNK